MAGASEENRVDGSGWYFSKEELEENTPSRRSGIDAKTEKELRRSCFEFLLEIGYYFKLPQLTVSTAIVLCHRFFLRQSHAENDKNTIATACMYLAGKVEETPLKLKHLILLSTGITHRNPAMVERLRSHNDEYQELRKVILLAERILLVTIDFDFVVHHPYKPLTVAIKRLNVNRKLDVFHVAWRLVNDGYRTSLCLQFRPPHIAAAVIYLASKYISNVKLIPLDWWRWPDFENVTGRHVKDACHQMLDLYEEDQRMKAQRANAAGVGTSRGSSRPGRLNLEDFMAMLRNCVENCEHELEEQLQQSLVIADEDSDSYLLCKENIQEAIGLVESASNDAD